MIGSIFNCNIISKHKKNICKSKKQKRDFIRDGYI